MDEVCKVLLSKEELIKLFKFVQRNDLLKYLGMKEYREIYAKSYSNRVDKVPDIIIANFLHNEVFNKHNKEICDHYNKLFSKVKENFEYYIKEISSEYLEVISSGNIYRFDEIINRIDSKQYELEMLPAFFKLIGINLSNVFLYVISSTNLREQEISRIMNQHNESRKNEIIKGIEKSYEVKINKLERNHNQKLVGLELKYNEEIKQLNTLVSDLRNENELMKNNYERQVLNLNERIISLESSINQLTKSLKTAEKTVKVQSEILDQKENSIVKLKETIAHYEYLLHLKVINKDILINVLNEVEFNNRSLKDNFKKFIDKLPENEGERNIELIEEWQGWVNEELNCISNILAKSISKGEFENDDLVALDEISYIIQFRYMLVRLLMALAYRYLSSDCWKEVFE